MVGLFLIGGGWIVGEREARGQESPAVVPVEAQAPVLSFSNANAKAAARLEAVRGQSLDELRGLLKTADESLPMLNKASAERDVELNEARTIADREAPEIRALYKQIEELQVKIAAVTDTLPGVREKLEAYAASQSALFEEMQFRTKLMALIASREASEPAVKKEASAP